MLGDEKKEHRRGFSQLFERRFATWVAVCSTVFYLCMEHVKAFATNPTLISNLIQTSSMAAWVSRFPRQQRTATARTTNPTAAFFQVPRKLQGLYKQTAELATKTSTSLSVSWSLNDLSTLPVSAFQSNPLRSFGSFYSVMDARVQTKKYEDMAGEYRYTFSSPTDSWPVLEEEGLEDSVGQDLLYRPSKRRPIQALRRAAGRAIGGLRPGRRE